MDAITLRNTLFVIGAIILAVETGLKGAPTLRGHLPRFLASEIWNFVPLGLMIVAGVIWVYVALMGTRPSIENKPSEATERAVTSAARSTPASKESSSAPASVADWRNRPASPWAGPIGPIEAVELVSTFEQLPKPCVVRVTAPHDNENLRNTIQWILHNGANCQIANPSSPPSADEPNVPNAKPGVIVHWAKDFSSGENIARFFDSSAYKVAISHRMPPNSNPHLIWIDIGPGSPWKD